MTRDDNILLIHDTLETFTCCISRIYIFTYHIRRITWHIVRTKTVFICLSSTWNLENLENLFIAALFKIMLHPGLCWVIQLFLCLFYMIIYCIEDEVIKNRTGKNVLTDWKGIYEVWIGIELFYICDSEIGYQCFLGWWRKRRVFIVQSCKIKWFLEIYADNLSIIFSQNHKLIIPNHNSVNNE